MNQRRLGKRQSQVILKNLPEGDVFTQTEILSSVDLSLPFGLHAFRNSLISRLRRLYVGSVIQPELNSIQLGGMISVYGHVTVGFAGYPYKSDYPSELDAKTTLIMGTTQPR